MILLELINQPSLPGDMENQVHTPKNDQSIPSLTSIRKSRLTLAQINKLRMMSDVRRYEERERLQRIKDQYSPAQEQPA